MFVVSPLLKILVLLCCVDRGSSISAMVCEGSSVSLACPTGQLINVEKSLYGGETTPICGGDAGAQCRQIDALRIVSGECEAQNSCTFLVWHGFLGGAPCSGQRFTPFLHITYGCVEADVPTTQQQPSEAMGINASAVHNVTSPPRFNATVYGDETPDTMYTESNDGVDTTADEVGLNVSTQAPTVSATFPTEESNTELDIRNSTSPPFFVTSETFTEIETTLGNITETFSESTASAGNTETSISWQDITEETTTIVATIAPSNTTRNSVANITEGFTESNVSNATEDITSNTTVSSNAGTEVPSVATNRTFVTVTSVPDDVTELTSRDVTWSVGTVATPEVTTKNESSLYISTEQPKSFSFLNRTGELLVIIIGSGLGVATIVTLVIFCRSRWKRRHSTRKTQSYQSYDSIGPPQGFDNAGYIDGYTSPPSTLQKAASTSQRQPTSLDEVSNPVYGQKSRKNGLSAV